jgi:hypothetical protein
MRKLIVSMIDLIIWWILARPAGLALVAANKKAPVSYKHRRFLGHTKSDS